MDQRKELDVIIVGGSYAGLAAGMALGRALRNVLINSSIFKRLGKYGLLVQPWLRGASSTYRPIGQRRYSL